MTDKTGSVEMNMESLIIKVAFPIFKYSSQVTHFTPRTPTVIERMILRLIHAYQNDSVIGKAYLLSVFEKQLGLANAVELVTPSIEDLLVLGVLERPQKELNVMQVADFRLSTLGREFYARNQLPGKSKDVQVEYVFEPLSQSWSGFKKTTSKSANNNGGIEIDKETFQPSNVNVEIRHCLEQDSYPWKTALTEIRSVDSELEKIQQNLQSLKLTVGKDGNLILEADDKNPDLQQWLKQVKPEYIRTAILAPAFLKVDHTNSSITFSIASFFSNSSKSASQYPQLNADKLKTAIKICPVNDLDINLAIEKLLPENAFFILALQNHPAFEELSTPHLILTEELSESLIWTADNKKTTIAQAIEPKDLPDDLLALIFPAQGKSPVAVFLGEAQLYWAGQAVKGLVATQQDDAEIDALWQQIRKHLETTLKSSYDPRVLALSLFWNPPETVINTWLEVHNQDSFEKLLQFGNEFEQAMQQVAKTKIDYGNQWQTAFSNKVSEKIALTDSFEYQDLCNHINAINDRLPNFKAKLHRELIAKALPIKKQNEFLEVRRLIGAKLEFPESFIALSLVADWMNCILSDKTIELAGPHEWVEDLERCKKFYQELTRNIGQKALDSASNSERIAAGSIKIKSLDGAKDWLQFSESMQQRSEFVYEQTNIKRLTEQVKQWKVLMDKYMVDPLLQDQKWLVFDTSALMDFPDILDKIGKLKNFKVALPLKVLDELDNLKHDNREEFQDRAKKAQSVIKKIESLSDSITQIKHIPELLPYEQTKDPSADDMIISAARSLALSPVILVSSDVNFRNKANALELQIMKTDDFVEKFFSLSPVKSEQKQNYSKKDYPKKGKKK